MAEGGRRRSARGEFPRVEAKFDSAEGARPASSCTTDWPLTSHERALVPSTQRVERARSLSRALSLSLSLHPPFPPSLRFVSFAQVMIAIRV